MVWETKADIRARTASSWAIATFQCLGSDAIYLPSKLASFWIPDTDLAMKLTFDLYKSYSSQTPEGRCNTFHLATRLFNCPNRSLWLCLIFRCCLLPPHVVWGTIASVHAYWHSMYLISSPAVRTPCVAPAILDCLFFFVGLAICSLTLVTNGPVGHCKLTNTRIFPFFLLDYPLVKEHIHCL